MPAVKQVWQFIQHNDYAFFVDLKGTYLHVHIVKYHHYFDTFFNKRSLNSGRVLPFGLATIIGFSLTKLILFLYWYFIIYMDSSLVLIHSLSVWALCWNLFIFGKFILGFMSPGLDLCHSVLLFLGLCKDAVDMSVSQPSDKGSVSCIIEDNTNCCWCVYLLPWCKSMLVSIITCVCLYIQWQCILEDDIHDAYWLC